MKQKLGICIVGSGYMGQIHAARWANLPEAEITAVVDLDKTRADKLARQYNLDRFYTDFAEAVALPEVDVVSICIPTCFHVDVAVAAADQGKHILCEKPIALTVNQADQMITATQKNNVKLGVGFMRRHSPVVLKLKNFLADKKLGRPVLYHASDVRELRPKREMHDANINGGPVIDMGVHLIDLWMNIFDSAPISVSAQGLAIGADQPAISHINDVAIDTASILVKFASGDIGTFVVTWGLPPKANPPNHKDQIYGPAGLIEAYYTGNKQEFQVMQEGGCWKTEAISHQDMYQNQAAGFARWILEDESFPTTGEDGKKALQVALAALKSIETGETVFLQD